MTDNFSRNFCPTCRHETSFVCKKVPITQTINGREYTFSITKAFCTECAGEVCPPGLIDKNIKEIDEQFRAKEGIVSISDIRRLLKIYNIKNAPASLALGFGEVTIQRYLSGQMPSKEYSDIISKALSCPRFMKQRLMENRDRVAPVAYQKSIAAAERLEELFSISGKLQSVIAYVFRQMEEVTPLMLQKILYYIQGIHLALTGTPIFEEDCQAWVHGPVYEKVYDLFKGFKYNPIDDDRFVFFEGKNNDLTVQEKSIVDLVLNSFGAYSGKTLERITHQEEPWIAARGDHADAEPLNVIISKQSILQYFRKVQERYSLNSQAGIRKYIRDMVGAEALG